MDYRESKEYKEAKEQASSKLELEKEMQITFEQHLQRTYGEKFVQGMKKKPPLISELKYELDPITKEVTILTLSAKEQEELKSKLSDELLEFYKKEMGDNFYLKYEENNIKAYKIPNGHEKREI